MPDVIYEMSLKDGLTNKLHQADGAATKLDATMGSLGRRLTHVAEAFGVSFALFKGLEFIHGATEEYEKFEFSKSQVIAGLKSTGYAAGVTADQLEESALKMAHSFKFTKSEITGMQSIMLTFPGVAKDTFDTASQAILDMSTRLHKGLDETAIMVGKALQDPERGITALRRVGVNFNDTQTEIIKKLVETGQAAKAQTLILKELQTEFAGSAEEAAKADVLFRYNKAVEELKLGIGEAADKMLEYFTPALEGVIDAIKTVFELIKELPEWYNKNSIAIDAVTGSLIGGVIAWKAYTLWTGRAAIATAIETGLMYGLGTAIYFAGVAMDILIAPITLTVAAVAALSAVVVVCWKKWETFRAVVTGVWEWIKELGSQMGQFFHGLGVMISNIWNPAKVAEGAAEMAMAFHESGKKLGAAYESGFYTGRNNFRVAELDRESEVTGSPKDITDKSKKTLVLKNNEDLVKPETKGAKGNKVVTINIKIDSLIKDFKINTTNIKEGTAKVQEMVTQVMMNAVNNSQIIASS